MPDTGERREIARFANAKEAETIQESTKLIAKTRRSARVSQENRSRKRRAAPDNQEKPRETEDHRRDQAASERMVDEGDPIHAVFEESSRTEE